MKKTPWVWAGLALLTPVVGLKGQVAGGNHAEISDVSARVTCPDCSIELRHSVRIGAPGSAGELYAQPLAVLRLPRGGFLVSESQGGRLLAFEESGGFLKIVASRGQGPQEILAPGPLVAIGGDSVAVVDFENGRFAILDPDSLAVARTVRIDVRLTGGLAEFEGHRVFSNGISDEPSRMGLPIHLIDLGEDPVEVQSFGSPDGLAIYPHRQERSISFGGGIFGPSIGRSISWRNGTGPRAGDFKRYASVRLGLKLLPKAGWGSRTHLRNHACRHSGWTLRNDFGFSASGRLSTGRTLGHTSVPWRGAGNCLGLRDPIMKRCSQHRLRL